MLHIQELLQSKGKHDGFAFLQEQLHITIGGDDTYSIFNYSQIDSPKTHPIVKECRGLILKNDTWEVVLFPFLRFFNYSETGADDIDFKNAVIQEKVDGSLVSLWHDGKNWNIATRKNMYGNNTCSSLLFNAPTFREMFFATIQTTPEHLDAALLGYEEYTFTFELCTKHNKVVKTYDNDTLYLLSIRNRSTLKEFNEDGLNDWLNTKKFPNVKLPTVYKFDTEVTPTMLKELLETFPPQDEGYVVLERQPYPNQHKRVKLKNPRYILLSHVKMSLSARSFIELVFSGEIDEFVGYYPEYKNYCHEILRIFYEFLAEQSKQGYLLLSKNLESRKEQAMYIKYYLSTMPSSYFFRLIDNPNLSAKEYWTSQAKKNLDNFIASVGFHELLADFAIDLDHEQRASTDVS